MGKGFCDHSFLKENLTQLKTQWGITSSRNHISVSPQKHLQTRGRFVILVCFVV